MAVLLLDGFPAQQSTRLQQALAEALANTKAQHIRLSETEITWCRGCFNCWIISPGECTIGGVGNDLARKFMNSDLVIFLSPVTFGSYSADLKKALDRLIPNLSGLFTQYKGETHHVKRYPKYPALAILGVQQADDPEAAAIFRELAERNSLNLYPQAFVSRVFGETWDDETIKTELCSVLEQVGVTV